ncbi:MAG: hypothetical protein ACE5MG_11275, partial [Candidatus Methylomirabilales bacterium]
MPAAKKDWELRFEQIRDELLERLRARSGGDRAPLKKADQEADHAEPAVGKPWPWPTNSWTWQAGVPRQQPWQEEYEAASDEVLSRSRGRAERLKKEVNQTGQFPLQKTARDFDPPSERIDPLLVRFGQFLHSPHLRKDANRNPQLGEIVARAKTRLGLIKTLSDMHAKWPAPNLRADIKAERLG